MFRRDTSDGDPNHEPALAGSGPPILKTFIRTLAAFESRLPGLKVGGMGTVARGEIVDPEKGVALSYRPAGGEVEVRVWVSERRAKLVTRTMDQSGIWTEITDRLALSLRQPPEIAGEVMPSTEVLAATLLMLMRRRATDAVLTSQDLKPVVERQVVVRPRRKRTKARIPHARPRLALPEG